VKHAILRRYAGAWAGIILRGWTRRARTGDLRRRKAVHLVFVDGFAGAGRYGRDADKAPPGPNDEPVWGSPVIGIKELEEQARQFGDELSKTVAGVLVEEDPRYYERLLASLEAAALDTPIVPADGFEGQRHGTVLVIRGDFRNKLSSMLEWLGHYPYILAFIDPFGPAMDLESMRKLLARERTDVISLFPSDDLKRRGGSVRKPKPAWRPSDYGNISRFDAHFGTEEWREIYSARGLSEEEREKAFVRLYTRQLMGIDKRNIIKTIGLRYAHAKDRTAYYLCMTTRDPQGAFKFNAIMREVAAIEDLEIWRDREATIRRSEGESGQIGLFDAAGGVPSTPPSADKYRANPEDVARALLERAATPRPISYKEVLRRMAASIFLESEIQSALRQLRSEGKAEFEGTKFTVGLPIWIKPA